MYNGQNMSAHSHTSLPIYHKNFVLSGYSKKVNLILGDTGTIMAHLHRNLKSNIIYFHTNGHMECSGAIG